MSRDRVFTFDPKLDLVLERVVDVPRALVWKAWTTPSILMRWFTPSPWKTVRCEIDLRPGGVFHNVMRSPDGKEFPNTGCYLEVVADERLVWTSVLGAGYRPNPGGGPLNLPFTAMIELEAAGSGTKYTATVIHGTAEDQARHDKMGFKDGWGKALEQLVAVVKGG
jgi:uncharacterized protein YndB with AHSA1/START domain